MERITLNLIKITFLFSFLFSELNYGQTTDNSSQNSSLPSTAINATETDANEDNRLKIRLNFNSVGVLNRQLLLTVDSSCSDGYDWGFDGHLYNQQVDDLSWMIEDELFVIQGIGSIDSNTNLPLHVQKGNTGAVIISIHSLENVPDDLDIILYDTEHGVSHDLRNADYQTTLEAGTYDSRFQIGFQLPSSLSVNDYKTADLLHVYFDKISNEIKLKNKSNIKLKEFCVYNLTGQLVYKEVLMDNTQDKAFTIENLSSEIYLVTVTTVNNEVLTKKVLIG